MVGYTCFIVLAIGLVATLDNIIKSLSDDATLHLSPDVAHLHICFAKNLGKRSFERLVNCRFQ